MVQTSERRYWTARQIADVYGKSVWTIRRELTPTGKRGREFVYAVEEVNRWAAGEPVNPAAPTPDQPVRRAAPVNDSLARIRDAARGVR